MTYDMNDAELPRGSVLIPDGSFVKVTMTIRKGGDDGHGEDERERGEEIEEDRRHQATSSDSICGRGR